MRITNNLLIHNMLWSMNNNLVSMNEKQTQLSSGKRIHKPSDDPVGTTRLIKVKSDIAENIQYKENARDAESWLNVSENSLTDTKDILQRIRELAVQGANGTYTDEETSKIAKEIDQLLEELIVNANSTIAGRYLFSGFNTDEPLLNKDGTFNVNITSEKMTDFKSIAYEVAVGESLAVGVNYLDVYGGIPSKNVVTDTFVFGNVAAGESRYGEKTGLKSEHYRIQGAVDHKKDLTAETMTVVVDGVTYTVDTSKLNGQTTQSEYTKILLDAEQTAPPAAYPPPTLSEVAEIYFVPSNNPENKDGELVIESKAFGVSKIALNGWTNAYVKNPDDTPGTNVNPGVLADFEGIFDYRTNYANPKQQLAIKVGGTNYYVASGLMTGTINQAQMLTILGEAKNAQGELLSDAATLSFNSINGAIPEVGILKVTAKEKENETISVVDEAGGFSNPSITEGKSAVQASILGDLDKTVDLRTKNLSFAYKGTTYTVDTSTLDGTAAVNEAIIEAAINAAVDGGGNRLDTVATVDFDDLAGTLSITANTAEDNVTFIYSDQGGAFTSVPTTTVGVAPIIPDFEGSFDVASVVGQPMIFTLDGTTYTVDTVGLDATNFAARVSAATSGGGTLGAVASVSFVENPIGSGIGHLSITSNTAVNGNIDINNSSLLRNVFTTVDGVAYADATKAKTEHIVDITTDLTAPPQTLTYELGGVIYTVDATQLDGNITQSEFIDLIRNASAPIPSTDVLSDVADIEFAPHAGEGNIGTLKIESKTAGADTIAVSGTGDIGIKYPITTGPEKAKIEGTFDYSKVYTAGSELSFEVDGKTYTVGALTFADSAALIAAIENADDGSGNLLGSVMDVSFTPTVGTSGVLVIEEKKGSDAVVNYTDPAGGFSGSVLKKNGTVNDTNVVLTGTEAITDGMVASSNKGTGIQSFVVTYNGETKRIDIDLTDITTTADMATQVNEKLKEAFGLNNDTPAINNVQFEIANDGTKNVVQFIGDGKDDGSSAELKVDVIMSEKPQMIQDIEDFSTALENKDDDGIKEFLGKIDEHLDNVIKTLADIGAKNNRLDFIENRIEDNNIAMTEILSKVQDIDYAEVTLRFKSLESIYRASLSVGAKVIQPTLVDFIQ